MTDSVKASRASVQIGSLVVDGFMLPDGSYRMSQTQVAQCIQDDPVYARNFLDSKAFKSLPDKGFTPETFEVDSSDQSRGQTRIQGWPLEIVYAYWVYRCSKGSKPAFNLLIALGVESLERRFDVAFGVARSEQERDQILSNRIQSLESTLNKLGEAYALDDVIRQERDRFEQLLREHGIDPWATPKDSIEEQSL